MEGENISFLVPSCSTIPVQEVPVTTQIIEEGPRVCPLCSSEVRLFYINFNDQMLMCENTQCDFPFGYEELQFVRVDGSEHSDTVSFRSKRSSGASSVISTATWSEIDRLNRVYESDDSQHQKPLERKMYFEKYGKKTIDKIKTDQIEKNVKEIKGLNREMINLSNQKGIIKNEKWIKKLRSLSGTQFLKPQELDQLKKKQSKSDNKELIINIQPGDYTNTISTIKIDIADKTEI